MTILEDLTWRGLYADCTDLDALTARLASGPTTLYAGFDPTADSLHVGNLVPLFALRRFQLAGHIPIALAGGATGMIGDPSGKSSERNLQTAEQVSHNIACIREQLGRFLDFDAVSNPAQLVDNASWTAPLTFLDFLRDIGKHFPVNMMIAKDSVKTRLESGGISFTEFTYMLLQANDFYHLRQTTNCELQVGATDQWGNITAGTELIRRKTGATAWGLTFPLLTKSDGTKYGKSADGAVWLDAKRTSVYRFFQFFMQAEDGDVIKLLKILTFLSPEEIQALEGELASNPGARAAQKALARALTTLVHGADAARDAETASAVLFGGGLEGITAASFADVVAEVPSVTVERSLIGSDPGLGVLDALVMAKLSPSKGQARKDVQAGGIYVNNERVTDPNLGLSCDMVRFDRYVLIRKGKRSYAVLDLV